MLYNYFDQPSVRVKCSQDDTVGDLKKLIAAQTGTDSSKIQLKKWCVSNIRSRSTVQPHPTNTYLAYSRLSTPF